MSKLNADKLDGKSSGAFLTKSVYDADKDGAVDSSEIKIPTAPTASASISPAASPTLCNARPTWSP